MAGSLRKKLPSPGTSTGDANRAAQRPTGLMFAGSAMAATENSAAREAREVMDIRQGADYLGISADSLYKYASESLIPAFKLGNRWRFKRSLLDAWMERQSMTGPVPAAEKSVKPRQKKPVARAR